MENTLEKQIPGTGRYLKKCSGCRREFRTDARNARFAPVELELCKCLEKRAKNRAKRRKEKRKYWKEPEKYRALALTRSHSRKKLLAYFAEHGIEPACNQCGKKGVRGFHCHHRDDDPFNLYLESYPLRSNLEWLCRACHEKADHAKHYGIVLWRPQSKNSWLEWLVELRRTDPRRFFTVPVSKLNHEWSSSLS